MTLSESTPVLEGNKDKLREFIKNGAQLCLTKLKPDHDLPSFHWEMDAGQNSPNFELLGSEFFGAAQDMLNSGELQPESNSREYMGREFTRLNLTR